MSFNDNLYLNWKLNINAHDTRKFYFRHYKFTVLFHPLICKSILYVFLYGTDTKEYDVHVHVVDKSQNIVHEQKYLGSLKCGPIIWSMNREEFLSSQDASENEMVTFKISIAVPEVVQIEKENEPQTKPKEDHASSSLQTLQDYSRFFNNMENSDVILQCGEQKIYAHRVVLSVHSSVFSAMFRSDMVESKHGVVNITDVEPAVLEKLVEYIYKGKVCYFSMESAVSLYKAADKYAVDKVKRLCVSYMAKNLSFDCACDLLLLAETRGDIDLKDLVESFMAKSKEFLQTDMWDKFSEKHPLLAVKIYKKFVRHALVKGDFSSRGDALFKLFTRKDVNNIQNP